MSDKKVLFFVFVAIAFVAVVVIPMIYKNCNNMKPIVKDNYCYQPKQDGHNTCICAGPRGRICQNIEVARDEYHNKGMTEYQDFEKNAPRKWSKVSPGDYGWNVPSNSCLDGGFN